MQEVKFYKSQKNGFMCVCFFDNYLLKNSDKLFEIINIFSANDLMFKVEFFVDKDKTFLDNTENITGQKSKELFKNKKLFYKREYSKVSIELKDILLLGKVIELAIISKEMLEVEFVNKSNVICVGMSVNDNDGTFLNFNTEKYPVQKIKEKISQIAES